MSPGANVRGEVESLARWIKVAESGELTRGEGRKVVVGSRPIALFRVGGEVFAIDDACPHQGASLAGGLVHDGRVICPLHSWVFDLRSGRCPRDSHEPVAAYPARCSGGAIEVQLPDED